jgi:Protein of unknown function (DUF2567)
MRQPGWAESTEPSWPGCTGTAQAAAVPQEPLAPAGWRPLPSGPRRSRWSRWRPRRGEVARAVVVVVVLATCGVGVGLVWWQVAPRLGFRIVSAGNGTPVTPESEQFFAADGWFVLLTLLAGLLAAGVVWSMRSFRGPFATVTLAAGGVLGAVVTWRIGLILAPAPSPTALRQVGQVVYPALRLRATAALVVEPIAAVLGYVLCAGFASRNDLGRPEGDATPALPPAY